MKKAMDVSEGSGLSAAEWNRLMQSLEKVNNVTAEPPLEVSNNSGGIHLRFAGQATTPAFSGAQIDNLTSSLSGESIASGGQYLYVTPQQNIVYDTSGFVNRPGIGLSPSIAYFAVGQAGYYIINLWSQWYLPASHTGIFETYIQILNYGFQGFAATMQQWTSYSGYIYQQVTLGPLFMQPTVPLEQVYFGAYHNVTGVSINCIATASIGMIT
jgi:hypothetical protein